MAKYSPLAADTKLLKKTIVGKHNDLVQELNKLTAELKALKASSAKTEVPAAQTAPTPVKATPTPVKSVDTLEGVQGLFQSATEGINKAYSSTTASVLDKMGTLHTVKKQVSDKLFVLENLYGLKVAVVPNDDAGEMGLAEALERLVKEHDEVESSFAAKVAESKDNFDANMSTLRKGLEETRAARAEFVANRRQEHAQATKRDAANYAYGLEQEEILRAEAVAEMRRKNASELKAMNTEAIAEWQATEDELREQELANSKVINAYDSMEGSNNSAIKARVNIITASMRKAADNDRILLETKFDSEIDDLQTRINAASETHRALVVENERLVAELSAAQARTRELAATAIEGASGAAKAQALQELSMELAKNSGRK